MGKKLFIVLMGLLYVTRIWAQNPPPSFFNTALVPPLGSSGLIPPYIMPNPPPQPDYHWEVSRNPSLGYDPAYRPQPVGAWRSENSGRGWITYSYTCSQQVGIADCGCLNHVEDLYFRIKFTLTGPIPVYVLNWKIWSDDEIVDIVVNNVYNTGFSMPIPPQGTPGNFYNNGVFNWCTNWQVGTNEVVVHVRSGPPVAQGAHDEIGLMVEGMDPLPVNIAGNLPVCKNTPNSYTASTVNGANNYQWSFTGGTASSGSSISNAFVNIPGLLQVNAFSPAGCIASNTMAVYVFPTPTINIMPSAPSICPGYSLSLTASGAVSYTWLAPSVPSQSANTNPLIFNPGPGVPTSYNVKGTDANGCVSNLTPFLVNMSPVPAIAVSASPPLICGPSNTLTASGASTYTWLTLPAGGATFTGNPYIVSPGGQTNYFVTGTAVNGCTSTAGINLFPGQYLPLSANNVTFCVDINPCTTLTVNSPYLLSCTWTPSPSSSSSQSTAIVCPVVNTIYTVVAQAPSTCGNTVNISVTTMTCCPPDLSGRFFIKPYNNCNTILKDLQQFATPQGSFSGVGVTYIPALNQYNFNTNGTLTPGSYPIVFTYTTSPYGCSYSLSQTVTLSAPVAMSVSQPTGYCISASVFPVLGATLATTPPPGTDYYWYPGGIMGQYITANPTVTTIYTVQLIIGDCVSQATTVVNIYSPCSASVCPPTGSGSLNIPPGNICSYTIRNLAQYATVTGTFSGNQVSIDPYGFYDFNFNSNAPAGTYTIYFTYIDPYSGCTYTLQNLVTVLANTTPITANAPVTICGYDPNGATLFASGGGANAIYNWHDILVNQPWGTPYNFFGTGASVVVHPTVTTQYIVEYDINGCLSTAMTTVTVNYTCCPQTSVTPVLSASVLNLNSGTNSLSGPIIIDHDITITTNGGAAGNYYFQSGDFIFNNNAKIILLQGVNLVLSEAHLFSCNNNMWKGIVVQDGANVTSAVGPNGLSTFIEDAEIAINLDGIFNPQVPLLNLNGVLFNKNYIGIKLHNSPLSTIPVSVRSCVFTCRDLPSSTLFWPGTDLYDMRYAPQGSANDIVPPYFMHGYPAIALKAPYTSQLSEVGIQIGEIYNVSNTMPTAGVDLTSGNYPNPDEFNVFDNLNKGFDVTNASLTTVNNVFQNIYRTDNGAINDIINSSMNARLFLKPSGPQATDLGNRFWNCHIGINAYNPFEFNLEQAVFRSTQNAYSFPPSSIGNLGIWLQTNRLNINISNNQFNNVKDGLKMFFYQYGPNYNVNGVSQVGVYGGTLTVNQNYFGPRIDNSQPANNGEYMDNAILVSLSTSNSIFVVNQANTIQSNVINRCFRGIYLFQTFNYPIDVSNNMIELADDNLSGSHQYGIRVEQSITGKKVCFNDVKGTGQGGNQNVALIEFTGVSTTPTIVCNTVYDAYRGFYFQGNHTGVWNGNLMSSVDQGLVLDGSSTKIGQQGSPASGGNPSTPSGNLWNSCGFATYLMNGANALNSKLYVSNANGLYIPNPNGNSSAPNDYNSPGSVNPIGGHYECPLINYPGYPAYRIANTTNIANVETDKETGITIYPNPTPGKLTITSQNENELLQVRVIDLTGKTVLEKTINGRVNNTIDLSSLNAALYFIEIQNSNKELVRKKIVKD